MAHEADIQNLFKRLKLARENAILGDYDSALIEFKNIFGLVHAYSSQYNGQATDVYSSKFHKPGNNSADYYLLEKWNQFKKDLKSEYDMIVQMHQTLLTLEDSSLHPSMFEELYEVDCLRDQSNGQRNIPKQSNKRP